ncbi:hypothetical protein QBC43DRAFT_285029 [Cladorrhinum sp. PSN259]|nr:hypothetical protein QBC43DRAFT_285029 [Cladorrhinum sp. PSN259]
MRVTASATGTHHSSDISSDWDDCSDGLNPCRSTPPRSNNEQFTASWDACPSITVREQMDYDGRRSTLKEACPMASFFYMPNPADPDEGKQWVATLSVKCNDVAALMRHGFEWTQGDIVHEEGHCNTWWCSYGADDDDENEEEYDDFDIALLCEFPMEKDARDSWETFVETRTWYLRRSESHGQGPAWVASIEVACLHENAALLAIFDPVKLLTKNSLQSVRVLGKDAILQFRWTLWQPEYDINCIYGDQKLPSIWPEMRPKLSKADSDRKNRLASVKNLSEAK